MRKEYEIHGYESEHIPQFMVRVSNKRIEGRAMALCFTYRPNSAKPTANLEKVSAHQALDTTRSHSREVEQLVRNTRRPKAKSETYRQPGSCLQLLTAF